MATYKEIQNYIKVTYGYVVQTCWIADIKQQYGLITRNAHNRINLDKAAKPCPKDKVKDIIQAFKYFEMIE